MSEAITPAALETLFTGARTHNGWLDIPVSDETLREIYDLMKWADIRQLLPGAHCVCAKPGRKREAAPGALQRQP